MVSSQYDGALGAGSRVARAVATLVDATTGPRAANVLSCGRASSGADKAADNGAFQTIIISGNRRADSGARGRTR